MADERMVLPRLRGQAARETRGREPDPASSYVLREVVTTRGFRCWRIARANCRVVRSVAPKNAPPMEGKSHNAKVKTMKQFLASSVLTFILFLLPFSSAASEGVVGRDGATMVLVPAGPFPMGVPEGARDGGRDEYPRHDVQLDTYYIDAFEVTNGRYLEFVKSTGHRAPQHPKDPTRTLWKDGRMPESLADWPVINVDWYDAHAYCRWADKGLRTEAQWAKAARGRDDRRFTLGTSLATNKN